MECPNCGTTTMPESYPVRVDVGTLVEDKALQFSNFKGIESAQPTGNSTVEVQLVQSAYDTYNHFKNRRKFDKMPHVNVADVDNGVVHLEFDPQEVPNIVTAFHCRDCDHVWDPEIGDLNSATPII